jgi:hypothetical protein
MIARLIRGEINTSMCNLGWKSLGVLELTRETVYVGLSAGSMVLTPSIGEDFVGWKPPTGGDRTLGMVDFSIFPHLDNDHLWEVLWNPHLFPEERD